MILTSIVPAMLQRGGMVLVFITFVDIVEVLLFLSLLLQGTLQSTVAIAIYNVRNNYSSNLIQVACMVCYFQHLLHHITTSVDIN